MGRVGGGAPRADHRVGGGSSVEGVEQHQRPDALRVERRVEAGPQSAGGPADERHPRRPGALLHRLHHRVDVADDQVRAGQGSGPGSRPVHRRWSLRAAVAPGIGDEHRHPEAPREVLGQRAARDREVEGGDSGHAGAVEEHHRLHPQQPVGGAHLAHRDADAIRGGDVELGPLDGGEGGERRRSEQGVHGPGCVRPRALRPGEAAKSLAASVRLSY